MDQGIETPQALGHAGEVAEITDAVLGESGVMQASLRDAAFRGGSLPSALQDFAASVRDHSERITESSIARLRSNGYSEDDIFEVTVAAALGAATRRLKAGLRAMERGK